jgi:hypothetical protein
LRRREPGPRVLIAAGDGWGWRELRLLRNWSQFITRQGLAEPRLSLDMRHALTILAKGDR